MLLQLDDNLPPPAQALPAVPHGVTLPELKLHDLYQGLRPAGPAQPTSLPAAMSEAETALLSALAAKAARVVEFGCGGWQPDWATYVPTISTIDSLWGHEWNFG
jgi:hypothetical protein